jgi:hypothetical protein
LKSFIILLIAYGIYFPIFFFANVPFGISQIKPYAGGTSILDVETFYDAAQAYQRLDLFGELGRAAYQRILMGDLIYPGLLGLFLSVTITLVLRNALPAQSNWHKLNLLPLVNLAADYLENILLITLLLNYPVRLNLLATIAGYLTFTKNMFGLLSYLALGASLIIWIYQRVTHFRTKSIEVTE